MLVDISWPIVTQLQLGPFLIRPQDLGGDRGGGARPRDDRTDDVADGLAFEVQESNESNNSGGLALVSGSRLLARLDSNLD